MALNRVKRLVTSFGVVFTLLAFMSMVVGFSSSHWLERYPHKRKTRVFVRMGLWEVCFNDWTYYKDYLGKQYNGCWWIFHFEYRTVWPWLNPPWLLAVQIMMTLALIQQMVTIVFSICYFSQTCPPPKERSWIRVCCILNFIGAAFIALSVSMFGYNADVNRQWLPNPDSNFLSWSFGFCVLSGFFSIFAGMCQLSDYIRIDEDAKCQERKSACIYSAKPMPRF